MVYAVQDIQVVEVEVLTCLSIQRPSFNYMMIQHTSVKHKQGQGHSFVIISENISSHHILTNNTGKLEVLKSIAARMQTIGTSILHEMDGIRHWFADTHGISVTEPIYQYTHHHHCKCAHTH
jgi:hypothetical protein